MTNSLAPTNASVNRPRRGVDAVAVVTQILGAILAHEHAPRLKDIEIATGIPSAKLHRYLVSLVEGVTCPQSLIQLLPSNVRYF